ncbi:acyltransferase [Rhodococcus pyridinivorans]
MLNVQDFGERNIVEVSPASIGTFHGTIIFTGDGNIVRIGPECASNENLRFELGSSSVVEIEGHATMNDMFVYCRRRAHLTIGSGSGFNGGTRMLMHEPGRIQIGEGALFAGQIDLSISDMHSIVDVETQERINPPSNIVIGDRVWVGQRSMILKGAQVGEGSIIGAMSVVAGRIPENSVGAGVPARVIRSGVTWRFDLVSWPGQSESDEIDPSTGAPSFPPTRGFHRLARKVRLALGRLKRAGRILRHG